MKSRRVTVMFFVVCVLLAGVSSQAQSLQKLLPPRIAHPGSPSASVNEMKGELNPATVTCSHSFTIPGALNGFVSYCVTVNGNIPTYQSPHGFDQIAQGGFSEGYGICD